MERNPSPHSEDNRISSIKAHLRAEEGARGREKGREVPTVYSFLYKHIAEKNVENVTGVAGQQGFK